MYCMYTVHGVVTPLLELLIGTFFFVVFFEGTIFWPCMYI